LRFYRILFERSIMSQHNFQIIIVLAIICLALVLPVCGVDAQKYVRFGCSLSLSGELEEEGILTKEGYELWKDYANSHGGIEIGDQNYSVDIIYYDDKSDPNMTALLVEKLITEDAVDFLLGPYGSSSTFRAAEMAEKYQIPLVQGGGPRVFAGGYNYTFGLLIPSSDYFKGMLEGAMSLTPRPNRVAIISADYPYLYIAEGAKEHAERLGFDIISFKTSESQDELSVILADLEVQKPDMVLLSINFKDAVFFVRTAKEAGLNFNILGIIVAPPDPAFVEELGEDAEYIYGPAQWTFDLPYDGPIFESSQNYARLFAEKYGKVPDYHSAAATACGLAYQLALANSTSLDHDEVRKSLRSLDVSTFYGRIKFNEQGIDIYNPMAVVQIQNGTAVTVWPENIASGTPIYPLNVATEDLVSWKDRKPLEIAVLYHDTIKDYGWCYEGHIGALQMAEELDYINISERDSAAGANASQMISEYADAGYGLIFGHGPEYGELIEELAPCYPLTVFMWCDGNEKKAPNAGTYFARMYEGRYLAGMLAGAMTKTDKIGYPAAMPIPEVIRGIDAFARGVASVNSNAKIYVEWIDAWMDPEREKEIAFTLINEGCDVITHHSVSRVTAEAAEERGVYYIGYHSDMSRFAPNATLTSLVWNWSPIMIDIAEAVYNGTWDERSGQDWWYGLAEGGVKLAPFSNDVPDTIDVIIGDRKKEIIEGEFVVFPGMTDEGLREIFYFEPNVEGDLIAREVV
jgi:basic membrane lipoprotein Med (substrate-binding protein (PBP1-ABC) superfamily)/ABC-type branched-subunit amino acid transport system substrate-binding protein